MPRFTFLFALAFIAMLGTQTTLAHAQNTGIENTTSPTENRQPSVITQNFAAHLSRHITYQLRSGEVAINRAERKDVRDFAQQMIVDFRALGTELDETLTNAQVEYYPPQTLTEDQLTTMGILRRMNQNDFDERYINDQEDVLKQMVTLTTSYAQTGDLAELKRLAARIAPTLRQHEQWISQLNSIE